MQTSMDVISLLLEDHQKIRDSFSRYGEFGNSEDDKKRIAENICLEASEHTSVEEEIFYPAVQEEITDLADKIEEAFSEHAQAKDMITEIRELSAQDGNLDNKVGELQDMLEHHMQEEEKELFPRVEKSPMDLFGLWQEITDLKRELKGEWV